MDQWISTTQPGVENITKNLELLKKVVNIMATWSLSGGTVTQTHDPEETAVPFQVNELQCKKLIQIVDRCIKKVMARIRSNMVPSEAAFKEFYRDVKRAQSLVLKCCASDWLKETIFLADCKEEFLLTVWELLWCTQVIVTSSEEITDWLQYFELVERSIQEDFEHFAEGAREDHQVLMRSLREVEFQTSSQEEKDLASDLHRKFSNAKAILELNNSAFSDGTPLGGGSHQVFQATWHGQINLAVKKFKPTSQSAWNPQLENEAANLAKVCHPHVIAIVGCYRSETSHDLVMERMGMNLNDLLIERYKANLETPYPLLVTLDTMLQIAEGMKYLHSINMVHRDLKSSNVLVELVAFKDLAQEGYITVKVADFDRAKMTTKSSDYHSANTGTRAWQAPELMNSEVGSKSFANVKKADVYSFGITCVEILTGRPPFSYEQMEPMADFPQKVKRGMRPKIPPSCPKHLEGLIKQCWTKNPKKRPTFRQICMELRRLKALIMTGRADELNLEKSRNFSLPDVNQGVQLQVIEDAYYQALLAAADSNVLPENFTTIMVLGKSDLAKSVLLDMCEETTQTSSHNPPWKHPFLPLNMYDIESVDRADIGAAIALLDSQSKDTSRKHSVDIVWLVISFDETQYDDGVIHRIRRMIKKYKLPIQVVIVGEIRGDISVGGNILQQILDHKPLPEQILTVDVSLDTRRSKIISEDTNDNYSGALFMENYDSHDRMWAAAEMVITKHKIAVSALDLIKNSDFSIVKNIIRPILAKCTDTLSNVADIGEHEICNLCKYWKSPDLLEKTCLEALRLPEMHDILFLNRIRVVGFLLLAISLDLRGWIGSRPQGYYSALLSNYNETFSHLFKNVEGPSDWDIFCAYALGLTTERVQNALESFWEDLFKTPVLEDFRRKYGIGEEPDDEDVLYPPEDQEESR